MTVGGAGPVRIAVIGQHAVGQEELDRAATRVHAVADLDRVARRLAGSYHVVATAAGRVRLQGSVTSLRRVFHAKSGEVTIAADRADVLATVLGRDVDEQRLALHLLDSTALHPLAGQPVWWGVDVVPGDRYLFLGERGDARTVPWWAPPEPVVPMAEGAPVLRDALAAAVAVRLRDRELASCDLGGLDSTALCSLAAGQANRVLAYTADGGDPLGQDATWGRRTASAFGNVEHEVIPSDGMPMGYAALRAADRLDEPCAAAVCVDRWLHIARSAAGRGSRLHFTGFGGDELLAGSPAHLHGLMRRNPRVALRNARGFAVQRRWPYREVLRQLMDGRDYRQWLKCAAETLTAPPPPMETPTLDWGRPPRMPPWATPDAVAAVRDLVREAARDVEPLSEFRGQHVELEAMRATSRMVRQLAQMATRIGCSLAAPYYDDRVVEAGLAVRPQERVTPWRYKPLIIEAMRDVVPAESLSRQTKDEGSYEVEAGLREHRSQLLSLCEDSRLAGLGLVDASVLRDVCLGPLDPSLQFDAQFQTVACEVWLRAFDDAPVGRKEDGHGTQVA